MADQLRFRSVLLADPGGRVYVEVPFDPDEVWGRRERHHVAGSIGSCGFRGPIERGYGTWVLSLGPAWRRDRGLSEGDQVEVLLAPEGPQRGDLDPDIAAALETEPKAGAFFDSLATFYRKGYLRWLDGAARRPQVRAERLREFVALLKEGRKQR
jgi:hypothetical protein